MSKQPALVMCQSCEPDSHLVSERDVDRERAAKQRLAAMRPYDPYAPRITRSQAVRP